MRWQLKPTEPQLDLVPEISKTNNMPAGIARLLAQRGVRTQDETRLFLHPTLDDLHSPYRMLGMEAAVERLERAIAATPKERILIYGDYDVDGTTAVVILKACIELLGGIAEYHVPHRIREGYGMKDDVIERAAADGVTMVISVDTGIRAFQAAETARRLGLDLIVTDHHLPESNPEFNSAVPHALAVLNPNQPGCEYPCKSLCGAGVAFKLAQALLARTGEERLLPSFLKMVAIATIADSVPLTGENRTMVKLGLEGLGKPVNGGLKALLQVAQLEPTRRAITATDVAFRVAPRINAAGRMDIAKDVVELFTTRDQARTRELAGKLNQLNADRQAEEAKIIAEIQTRLADDATFSDAYCVVIDGEDWHRGVIGIAASRVVERTGKPALVIARDGAEAHGSGRSIPAFHLLDALDSGECRDLFTRYGGHAHAVGFALPSERIAELRRVVDAYARTRLAPDDLIPLLELDAEINLEEITADFMRHLRMMEPFGMGNREPVFMACNLRLLQPPRILKEKHIKLKLAASHENGKRSTPPSPAFDALGWRMAERLQQDGLVSGDCVDVAFTVEENQHPDFGGLQLVMRDYRRAAKREN